MLHGNLDHLSNAVLARIGRVRTALGSSASFHTCHEFSADDTIKTKYSYISAIDLSDERLDEWKGKYYFSSNFGMLDKELETRELSTRRVSLQPWTKHFSSPRVIL